MIDKSNLSKIKEINILHFQFDFRYGRTEVGSMCYAHYPVAYINENYLYYIVANKQPLKLIYTDRISDDLCILDNEIDARLNKTNFGNFDFVFIGSKKDACEKMKEVSEKIRSKRDALLRMKENDKNYKKYKECLEFISWYNKTYLN